MRERKKLAAMYGGIWASREKDEDVARTLSFSELLQANSEGKVRLSKSSQRREEPQLQWQILLSYLNAGIQDEASEFHYASAYTAEIRCIVGVPLFMGNQ